MPAPTTVLPSLTNQPAPGARPDASTSVTQTERDRWIAELRRSRMTAGTRPTAPATRGSRWTPELRRPVPKCRLRHPRREARTCESCKRRTAYVSALRRDEIERGYLLSGFVDVEPVKRYLTDVLIASGRYHKDIARLSGVGVHVISSIVRGKQDRITAVNADALFAVRPAETTSQPPAGMVNAVGVRRILRGLSAQGWTAAYMAQLEGITLSCLSQLMNSKPNAGHPRRYVTVATFDLAKRLAEKLGPFDLAYLDKPLDGMSLITAQRATKRGWLPLDAWEGLDIADPATKPHGHDALDHRLGGYLMVEPQKIENALDEREIQGGLRFDVPFTQFEIRHVILAGSLPSPTGEPRYSAEQLATRTGLTSRTVQRIRAELGAFHDLLASGVTLSTAATAAAYILASLELPPTIRLQCAQRILRGYPLSRRDFYRHLVVLMLIHPEPYGLGWSDDELATWLGVSADRAGELRLAAVDAGRCYYQVRNGQGGRSRRSGTTLPAAA